jgi:hypothetical protein
MPDYSLVPVDYQPDFDDYRPRLCDSGLCREGTWNSPTFSLTAMVYRRELWDFRLHGLASPTR